MEFTASNLYFNSNLLLQIIIDILQYDKYITLYDRYNGIDMVFITNR